MTDTPTTELTKYESLLLMISSASPQFAFRRGEDETSNAVVRDLMLVNTFIAQFVTVNEIECRNATAVTGEQRIMVGQRGLCRGGRGDVAHTVGYRTRAAREAFGEIEELSAGTDPEAFTKGVQTQARATFSAACCQRLDELAREKAKEQFSERVAQLANQVVDAHSRLDNVKKELATVELVHEKTAAALKKLGGAHEQ